jgi:nucleoside-diphosphate-sugar epimerase
MGNLTNTCTNKPSFLLFGNGWIGSKVYKYLVEKGYKVHIAYSRADDYTAVETEILTFRPTHVMSFIGRTHGTYEGNVISTIDYLEKPGKLVENMKDNLYAPLVLASVCKKLDCHFTYLGTGCIFEYDDLHPFYDEKTGFTEADKPNFFGSSYSIVKGYTDRLMHELYSEDTLNIRIRMPITSEVSPRNFITKITNYEKICSVPNSMTVLDNLIPVLVNYAIEYRTGTVNLTNPGTITHNEILEMYRELVEPTFSWVNFSIEEQNQILSSKRSNNCLDTTTLQNDKTNNIQNIKEAVRDVLIQMKKDKDQRVVKKTLQEPEQEPEQEHEQLQTTVNDPLEQPLQTTLEYQLEEPVEEPLLQEQKQKE